MSAGGRGRLADAAISAAAGLEPNQILHAQATGDAAQIDEQRAAGGHGGVVHVGVGGNEYHGVGLGDRVVKWHALEPEAR